MKTEERRREQEREGWALNTEGYMNKKEYCNHNLDWITGMWYTLIIWESISTKELFPFDLSNNTT